MSTPAKSLLRFNFYALAGVEEVRVEGLEIVGRWKNSLEHIYSSPKKRLAEQFANCASDDAAIVRFTKRYGPLTCEALPGAEFRFRVQDWRFEQDCFRQRWEHLRPQRGVKKVSAEYQRNQGGDGIEYEDGSLRYRTTNLNRFLLLDLLSCPAERLRRCARPDCENPYFVASHLGQRYCSEKCAGWKQQQHKKEWWKHHGKEWRAKQRKGRRK
jgi:hypothetical protein